MTFRFNHKTCLLAATSLIVLAAAASSQAAAPQTAAAETASAGETMETVVVTGTAFNTDAAPAKSSLDTMQPETIINRSYIEDFTPPQADYVGILSIAPSMTGTDANGPGLSDGGPKNTMRGFSDGMFGMSYDGIPFGDTNGPSHHSISYFPASTIGSVLVDRGPGNAGTLGAATYGGTIQLFSEPLTDDMHLKALGSYGTWNTRTISGNAQSGALGDGDATRIMLNLQDTYSDGAISLNNIEQKNALLKINHNFGDNWVVTLFGNYNYINEALNDNAGVTPAQVAIYGKQFGLQDTDPKLGTYAPYNWVTKKTDMDYLREQGAIGDTVKLDNTTYTYMYMNHTFTATNPEQTITDINNDVTEGNGTVVNGQKLPNDVPGYTKTNAYRVWGDILRLSDDYQFGGVSGQVRAGLWWEGQKTWRGRYDFDRTLCYQDSIDPYATTQTQTCRDSSLSPKGSILLANGYAEYDEHSSWYQYEPFAEVDIKPFDGLTLTPGVKYVDWLHKTNGLEQKLIQFYNGEYTTRTTLPFFEANYKITSSWSVYAQYAKGIYVPDISSFEQKTGPTTGFPAPEKTTNYQIGTVFYSDNFTFDADVYDIPISNNYSYVACNTLGGPTGDTCAVNTGTAVYKGVEGEATYSFAHATGTWLDGLSAFTSGSLMSSKSQGLWLQQAPAWTLAGGLLYKYQGWKFSIIDKAVGQQYSDNVQTVNYKVGSYNTTGVGAGYTFGIAELDFNVDNLLDSRKVVSIKVNDKAYMANQLLSLNQFFYQAPLSVMATVKIRY